MNTEHGRFCDECKEPNGWHTMGCSSHNLVGTVPGSRVWWSDRLTVVDFDDNDGTQYDACFDTAAESVPHPDCPVCYPTRVDAGKATKMIQYREGVGLVEFDPNDPDSFVVLESEAEDRGTPTLERFYSENRLIMDDMDAGEPLTDAQKAKIKHWYEKAFPVDPDKWRLSPDDPLYHAPLKAVDLATGEDHTVTAVRSKETVTMNPPLDDDCPADCTKHETCKDRYTFHWCDWRYRCAVCQRNNQILQEHMERVLEQARPLDSEAADAPTQVERETRHELDR